MYDCTCPNITVNECRCYLFSNLGRVINSCPPAKDALLQHVCRKTLQSYLWSHCAWKMGMENRSTW